MSEFFWITITAIAFVAIFIFLRFRLAQPSREKNTERKTSALHKEQIKLPISVDRRADIQQDITKRLSDAGRALPTDEQWDMILHDSTCVRVVAGAGSGKSTTLVYRLIVLRFYLNVSWNEITVVTFTNNSRDDFVKKLRYTVKLWGEDMPEKQAEGIVRTFHSLGFRQAARAGLLVETIDKPKSKKIASIPSSKQHSEIELPFGPYKIDPEGPIVQLLNRVGAELMISNAHFSRSVMKLYDAAFLRHREQDDDADAQEKRIYAVQKNDSAQTAYMEQLWRETIAPQLMNKGLIDWCPGSFFTGRNQPGKASSKANGPWWGNAKLPQLSTSDSEVWLLLGATPQNASNARMPRTDRARDGFSVLAAIDAKKNCVNTLTSTTSIIWINSADDLIALHDRLIYRPDRAEKFPKFKVKLTGELGSDWLLLLFWKEAQFIQSLGLDVVEACLHAASQTKGIDAHFAAALAEFWPAFEANLEEQGLTTSARVFHELGKKDTVASMPDDVLRSTKHLMIDEFQDISGNLVKWIGNLQAEHATRLNLIGEVPSSFMVVGDDFQSIYGWRGASPRYFTKFSEFFGTAARPASVLLRKNFRSSQAIINAAQLMLRDVSDKVDKPGIADDATPVSVLPVKLLSGENAHESGTFERLERGDFILSRKGSSRDGITSLAEGMTIHGSKGLEATYVVMVDDIVPPPAHPIRASFYRLAKLGDYNQAQVDESHRLAYVAITRAKFELVWAVKEPFGDGMFNVLSSALKSVEKRNIQ